MNNIVEIKRLGINGEGIGYIDGKIVFIPFALPDERVECEIANETKSYYIGKLKKIDESSIDRCDINCPYYKICGGCQLLHLNYDKQLEFKSKLVYDNLLRIGKIDANVEKCLSFNEKNYRNHTTFAVSTNGKLGFFQEKSHNVLEISSCLISDEKINASISLLNSYFFDNHLYGYNYTTKKGQIKSVDIKTDEESLLITIVANVQTLPNIEQLCVRLNTITLSNGIFLSVKSSQDTHIYGDKLIHLSGIKFLKKEEMGIKSFASSYSFAQVNNLVAYNLYKKVVSFIGKGTVLDCYSGRAVLSCAMAKFATKVVAVELVKDACIDAENIAEQNGIKNIEIVCSDVSKFLQNNKQNFNTVVLDPPRNGVDRNTVEAILKLMPEKIIYISCASNTLARDLQIIMSSEKYSLKLVQPFDMFPQTSNVETLVVLEKK